ncbi:MAG: SGNH/GDSL hydrolase family protein [Deltaproteobacteria bacterium]|nr:MAG: SGNH/GDSL hydrolase family protein [Deltaproteobacteria bacterium]
MPRPLLARGGAVLLGLAVLVVLELGLRVLAPRPGSRLDLYPLHGADGAVALAESIDLDDFLDRTWTVFQRDRLLLWRVRPMLALEAGGPGVVAGAGPWRLHTDASGRRVDPDGPGGPLRVVALGDSSVFGWGVDDDEVFVGRLPADTVNLAVPGYSAVQGRVLAEQELAALHPEVLVLGFGANDGHLTGIRDEDALAARRGSWGRVRYAVSDLQVIIRLRDLLQPVRLWMARGALRRGVLGPRVDPLSYAAALRQIAALAPGARVVLVGICERGEYRDQLRRIQRESGASLVTYDGETLDGCHPDPAGHAALARRIGALLP